MWAPTDWVLIGGFIIALVFGVSAERSLFCAVGAISDWILVSSRLRAYQWLLHCVGVGGAPFMLKQLNKHIS